MIKIEVQSTRAVIRYQEPLTVGLRGAKAHFVFGDGWDGLVKTAVFRQGDKTVAVADIDAEVTVPWEVLTQPGLPVQIGVYGTNGSQVAIPTLWAVTQPVRPGTDPEADPSAEPTPGLWEQMQGKLDNLEASVNEASRAVKVTITQNADGSYTADRYCDELLDAYNAGYTVYCQYGSRVFPLLLAARSQVAFGCVYADQTHTVMIGHQSASVVSKTLAAGDGITPHIGANGNWFIGETDTGMPSRGEAGPTGAQGEKGEPGPQGIQGEQGPKGDPGSAGADGAKGEKGDKGDTGAQGPKGDTGAAGPQGPTGATGADGKTPVKGTDYWTQADQEAIVQQVIAALGTPVFGRVDADHNIILTGELADGTYVLKYEDAEGNVTEIGTLNHTYVPEPTYTNVLPLAINTDGTKYNGGQGWKTGARLNSSGAESTSSAEGVEVTGFIPVKSGDKVYLRNVTMNNSGEKANQTYMWLYDASFAKLEGRYKLFSQFSAEAMNSQKSQGRIDFDGNGNLTMLTIDHNVFYTGTSLGDLSNAAYLRISCEEIDGSSIITVNEPIV